MTLNLDRAFKPLDDGEIEFESFTFPGGEPHIKINPNFDHLNDVVVTHRINSFNDIGFLCLAVDALLRLNVELSALFIPYFPSARQDRVMIKGEPLSVKVYSDIVNGLGFKKVIVYDAHSEVTPALVRNCEVVPNHRFIGEVIKEIKSEVKLIVPDGGALKKIYKLSEYLGGIEVIECGKSRDVKTGQLTGFKVHYSDLRGQDCLIVDDICDGGATFMGLAKELERKNCGRLYLAVSHGIFSKGLDGLSEHFSRIFTTNSIRELKHDCLTQISLSTSLLF